MSDYSKIIFSAEGAVARITLDDPAAANALSPVMLKEFKDALRRVEDRKETRICVIDSMGKNFCAGANLAANSPEENNPAGETPPSANRHRVSDDLYRQYFPILDAIAKLPVLFIIKAQGAIAGIAGALVMTADFLIMAEDAYIYQPFMAINLVPDGGIHWHLVRTIGYKRALDLILTGKRLPAAQCVEVGLANKAVPGDLLDAEVAALVDLLLSGPPMAQRASKKLCRAAATASLIEMFDLEAEAQNPLIKSEDFETGISAFFRKQPPQFKGR